MTIKSLIESLKKFSPDRQVFVAAGDSESIIDRVKACGSRGIAIEIPAFEDSDDSDDDSEEVEDEGLDERATRLVDRLQMATHLHVAYEPYNDHASATVAFRDGDGDIVIVDGDVVEQDG